MKRFACLLLAVCLAALISIDCALTAYAGRAHVVYAKAHDPSALTASLTAQGESILAYRLSRTDEVLAEGKRLSEDATLLEYYAMERTGLRIALERGGYPMRADEIMLSAELARRIVPNGDCLGATVSVRGREYAVAGVYRPRRTLLSQPVPIDCILPAGDADVCSPVYVYEGVRAQADEQLLQGIADDTHFPPAETLDLAQAAQAGRQTARCFLALMVIIPCASVWRREKKRRRETLGDLRRSIYSTPARVFGRAGLSFLVGNYRSWLSVGAALFAVIYCAARLTIAPGAIPSEPYSLRAWLTLAKESARQADGQALLWIPVVRTMRGLTRGAAVFGGVGTACSLLLCAYRR